MSNCFGKNGLALCGPFDEWKRWMKVVDAGCRMQVVEWLRVEVVEQVFVATGRLEAVIRGKKWTYCRWWMIHSSGCGASLCSSTTEILYWDEKMPHDWKMFLKKKRKMNETVACRSSKIKWSFFVAVTCFYTAPVGNANQCESLFA